MGRLVATPPPPSPPRRRRSRRNLSLSWQHRPFFRERTDEDDTTTAPHGSTLMGLLFNNSLELTSEATAPQLRTKPKRRSRDSSRPSPLPRSLHFIHLHYKLVYYFALLARAARKKSWHNETSPRGCFEAQQRLKWIWWFGLQKEVTSWNKDFLHFRQPAAAFLRLYLYLHDTSQSIITVSIRYGVSSWCFIFPHNTRVKCNIFYRQRPLYASERLSRIWPEVDKSSRRLVDFARENRLL